MIKYPLLILIFIISLFIFYSIETKTNTIEATICIIEQTNVEVTEIGKTLIKTNIAVENSNKPITVIVEYILNKQKYFEEWKIPTKLLVKYNTKRKLSAIINYTYIPWFDLDLISFITIDNIRISQIKILETSFNKEIK